MPAPKQVSPRQMELLLQYMEKDRPLALGQLVNSGPLARHETSMRWEAVASSLNSLGEGVSKTGMKWRNYWNNLKYSVRHKAAEYRGHAMRTGGGPPKRGGLTPLEERILSVIGKVSVHGNESVRIAFNPLPDTPSLQTHQWPLPTEHEDDDIPPVYLPQTAMPHVSPLPTQEDDDDDFPPVYFPQTAMRHGSQQQLESEENVENFPPIYLPHTSRAMPHVSRAVVRTPSLAPHASRVVRTLTLAPHASVAVRTPTLVRHASAVVRTPTLAPHTAAVVRTPTLAPHTAAVVRTPTLAPHTAAVVRTPTLAPHTAAVVRTPTLAPHTAAVARTPPLASASVATPELIAGAASPTAPNQQSSRRRRNVQSEVPQWALEIEERRLEAQEDMAASMREVVRLLTAVAADVAAIRSRLQ